MFNLDTRVDLDEIILITANEELSGTGVSFLHVSVKTYVRGEGGRLTVVDGLGQANGVVQDGVADLGGQILGRGNLDDLLVSPLDGAVTLVQMDDVAVVVTKELNLDVLGLVEEPLDENGAVTEGALGLGGGAFERLLEGSRIADDTHATAATTVGRLDDDGEAILVCELLDLLECANSTLGTGDDRDVGGNSDLSSRNLVAEGINDVRGRSNELEVEQVSQESIPERSRIPTMRPAFSTLRANSAFSDKKP